MPTNSSAVSRGVGHDLQLRVAERTSRPKGVRTLSFAAILAPASPPARDRSLRPGGWRRPPGNNRRHDRRAENDHPDRDRHPGAGSCLFPQDVADPADGLDQPAALHLAPQVADGPRARSIPGRSRTPHRFSNIWGPRGPGRGCGSTEQRELGLGHGSCRRRGVPGAPPGPARCHEPSRSAAPPRRSKAQPGPQFLQRTAARSSAFTSSRRRSRHSHVHQHQDRGVVAACPDRGTPGAWLRRGCRARRPHPPEQHGQRGGTVGRGGHRYRHGAAHGVERCVPPSSSSARTPVSRTVRSWPFRVKPEFRSTAGAGPGSAGDRRWCSVAGR